MKIIFTGKSVLPPNGLNKTEKIDYHKNVNHKNRQKLRKWADDNKVEVVFDDEPMFLPFIFVHCTEEIAEFIKKDFLEWEVLEDREISLIR